MYGVSTKSGSFYCKRKGAQPILQATVQSKRATGGAASPRPLGYPIPLCEHPSRRNHIENFVCYMLGAILLLM